MSPPPATAPLPPIEQAVVVVRADGTVAGWNAGATALYGYSEAEAGGRRLEELLPTVWPRSAEAAAEAVARDGGWSGIVVRADRDGDALACLMLRGRAADFPGGAVETTLRMPDASVAAAVVPGELELTDRLFILEPVRGPGGEVADMRVVYVNGEGAASVGRSPGELVGRPASDVLPGYRDSSMFATHREVMRTREPASFADRRVELPPGSGVQRVLSGAVAPFGAGVAVRMRDVTAERRALQALDDAQARIRMALAIAPVGVAQLNRDLEYEWLIDNLTHADPADVVGRPFAEHAAPEHRERLRAAAERVLAGGDPERLELTDLERTRTFELIIAPRHDPSGAVAGIRTAALDVSAHRRLEDELRHSRDMMRAVLDHAPGPALVTDLEGRIAFANTRTAELLGLTPDAAVGRRLADLMAPEPAARIAAHEAAVLRTGEDLEAREEIGGAPVLVRRFPIRDERGQISALGAIALATPAGDGPRSAALTAPPRP